MCRVSINDNQYTLQATKTDLENVKENRNQTREQQL